jgi:hypothetical protein
MTRQRQYVFDFTLAWRKDNSSTLLAGFVAGVRQDAEGYRLRG